ncbi:tRNA (adenosine(37)-N6)-dimethylallyltransferase MiaA [Bacillus sp. V3B]|uniref:tRNA (adenosine(37)-N6)-dimethylallyltransferase MiaA n=1 Tax=Bacillus sp. V3B TaxID=2804915 RepID=UPI0021089D49|nr:tRNA (adenosine(37)-N6)-dimethylallyltransferase MiaA [Bacillus sp. V3B]MCQ6274184.1 tRNA (adenosine(37)-N6)-dimethylallyltransferase MiaA [Bacillus sp. V3B]
MTTKCKLLVLIGPTAVGKTKTSIELAKAFNGEIISGDSMQVYKKLDIGTAKIKPLEMEGIPHYLIDIKDPDEPFSAAEFQVLVRDRISEITSRGKLPIIVGGTGLYIQSVLFDYQFSEAPTDDEFRKNLEMQAEKEGIHFLHDQLMKLDPESGARIHPNNVRRVIRAIEVFHCTGKTMSEFQRKQQPDSLYDTAIVGLTMDREKLYARINKRVDMMIHEGLVHEVEQLFQQGLKGCQSIQAIGYKEMYEYFEGKVSFEQAVENLKQNSRRYAKRQLTWFRNKMDVKWFDMTEEIEPISLAKKIDEISTYIEGMLKIRSNT